MAAAGFAAGRHKAYNQLLGLPEYYQNVFELLGDVEHGKPGDFYLDLDQAGKGFVYYVTAAPAAATMGGAADAPIHAVLPQVRKTPIQAGPEAGPTSAFCSFAPARMHAPARTVWASLTPFALTARAARPRPARRRRPELEQGQPLTRT